MLCNKTTGEVTFAGVLPTKHRPCPICEKPDWCLVDRDRNLTICQRVESKRRIGEAGWLHGIRRADEAAWVFRAPKPEERPTIDWQARHEAAMQALDDTHFRNGLSIEALTEQVGLSEASLSCFEVGCIPERLCWTFPMRDGDGKIIGLRTRTIDGRKFAVPGSRNGLFIPVAIEDGDGTICVEEGPTSAAAVLEMGMDCIGRPSCSACVAMTVQWLQRQKRSVCIIANADSAHDIAGKVVFPGQEGARALASALVGQVPSVKVILPQTGKDSRDWFREGGNNFKLVQVIRASQAWVKPLAPSNPHAVDCTKPLSSVQVDPAALAGLDVAHVDAQTEAA